MWTEDFISNSSERMGEMEIHQIDTVVVGSGCAALNAADWLRQLGKQDLVIVTEGLLSGTSRNTGSDKQTYYKLSLCGSHPDSVYDMARTLYDGGGVEGDIALAEAAGSVQSFMKLVNLGVPFPTNAWGEFVGYQTDHDATKRATSAGPLTSRYMTEALEREVKRKQIPIWDSCMAVKLFVRDGAVRALLCLEEGKDQKPRFHLIFVRHVVWCSGGPSGCYRYRVYPESQTGMSGVLLREGARGRNLQEWQYGLASVAFRWNVSGTYQQVIPRYISVDRDGVEREFLLEQEDADQMPSLVFLKGYQWPFDVKKAEGSSRIDRLVYEETIQKGRTVYMDFRRNPGNLGDFSGLCPEAHTYLERSGALFGTPIERLERMNPMAVKLYRDHGIDLHREPLEVMVCAQHHNGGIEVDADWQSSIRGLYVAGEAAGTFGPYRPGGTALNSAQVGSMRAAQHIVSLERQENMDGWNLDEKEKAHWIREADAWIREVGRAMSEKGGGREEVGAFRRRHQEQMSSAAAHMRSRRRMERYQKEWEAEAAHFFDRVYLADERKLPLLLKTYDMLLTQCALLSAMLLSADVFHSRGGAWVEDDRENEELRGRGKEQESEAGKKERVNRKIVTVGQDGRFVSVLEPVAPIPVRDDWFEAVWAEYRTRQGMDETEREV